MQSVKVKKSTLHEAVKTNLEKHRAEFEKAIEGYRKEAIEILNHNIDGLKSNRNHVVCFTERPPEDHTKDYNRVLSMLEMSVDDVIQLSAHEFQQYVMDDWSWKNDWTATTAKYLAK